MIGRLSKKFAFAVTLLAAIWMVPQPEARSEETSPLLSILPAKLEDSTGKTIDPASLKGKHVGLYFSAHWCPPCRAFTPSLVKFRNEHADEDFEVVFVSLDNSEGEKRTYIEEMGMQWLTVPGARSNEAQKLAERYQIRGIPSLIVIAPDGSLVTADGRSDVMGSPQTALRKWKENPPS